jgi:hypothetical protein
LQSADAPWHSPGIFGRLSISEIADRLARSPATIKAYVYDPAG